MWWKNNLIVFIVTSVLVLVTMFSCNTAEKETERKDSAATQPSLKIMKAPAGPQVTV